MVACKGVALLIKGKHLLEFLLTDMGGIANSRDKAPAIAAV